MVRSPGWCRLRLPGNPCDGAGLCVICRGRRLRSRPAPHEGSHSGLLEPRGTSTVLKEPGVRDSTTWSVIP